MPAPVLPMLHHMIEFYVKKTFIRSLQTSVAQFRNPNSWNGEARFSNTTRCRAGCHCGKLTVCYQFVKVVLYNHILCIYSNSRLENIIC